MQQQGNFAGQSPQVNPQNNTYVEDNSMYMLNQPSIDMGRIDPSHYQSNTNLLPNTNYSPYMNDPNYSTHPNSSNNIQGIQPRGYVNFQTTNSRELLQKNLRMVQAQQVPESKCFLMMIFI